MRCVVVMGTASSSAHTGCVTHCPHAKANGNGYFLYLVRHVFRDTMEYVVLRRRLDKSRVVPLCGPMRTDVARVTSYQWTLRRRLFTLDTQRVASLCNLHGGNGATLDAHTAHHVKIRLFTLDASRVASMGKKRGSRDRVDVPTFGAFTVQQPRITAVARRIHQIRVCLSLPWLQNLPQRTSEHDDSSISVLIQAATQFHEKRRTILLQQRVHLRVFFQTIVSTAPWHLGTRGK